MTTAKSSSKAIVTVTRPRTGEVVWAGTVDWDQVARTTRNWASDMGTGRRAYKITVVAS